MIPQDTIRELATILRFSGDVDCHNPAELLDHARDIMHNRSAAWRHFDAEVLRRCRVQGRLKAARAKVTT